MLCSTPISKRSVYSNQIAKTNFRKNLISLRRDLIYTYTHIYVYKIKVFPDFSVNFNENEETCIRKILRTLHIVRGTLKTCILLCTLRLLFKLVENRQRYCALMQLSPWVFSIRIALNATNIYRFLFFFSPVLKQRSEEVRVHVQLRNRKDNRSNVSSQFRSEERRDDVPRVLLSLF